MSEEEFLEAKRLRRAAHEVFDTQKELVKADFDAASIGQRAVNRLVEDGRYLAEEAGEAANRHKVALSAGALALTGWFLRKPLIAFATSLLGNSEDDGEYDEPEVEADKPAKTEA